MHDVQSGFASSCNQLYPDPVASQIALHSNAARVVHVRQLVHKAG